MTYRYEIDETNAIRVWDSNMPNENDAPFLLQPNWPNGTSWASEAEASAWAELYIQNLENPESEFFPGDGPDLPKKLRPTELTVEEENA
jgi:hypothetical protein